LGAPIQRQSLGFKGEQSHLFLFCSFQSQPFVFFL
jgi:hypothetical protein